jgi:hypothetical protein
VGKYNSHTIQLEKGGCISVRSGMETIEFRMGKCTFTYKDITFILSTLWSKINPPNSYIIQKNISDFEFTMFKDEFLIVDDINELYPTLDIKLLEIKEKDKWWVNPCVPFNMGFKKSSGDVIIIQNPECLHMGEIIKTVEEQIQENRYLVFGCYSLIQEDTDKVNTIVFDDNYIENIKNIIRIEGRTAINSITGGWYQNSKYRNNLLHFCTAITKKNLDELGGFDERFAYGVGKDDREFVVRINRKRMEIKVIDKPFVIHQRHKPFNYANKKMTKDNNEIFNIISRENKIKANE